MKRYPEPRSPPGRVKPHQRTAPHFLVIFAISRQFRLLMQIPNCLASKLFDFWASRNVFVVSGLIEICVGLKNDIFHDVFGKLYKYICFPGRNFRIYTLTRFPGPRDLIQASKYIHAYWRSAPRPSQTRLFISMDQEHICSNFLRGEFAFMFQTFSRNDPPGKAPPSRGHSVSKK